MPPFDGGRRNRTHTRLISRTSASIRQRNPQIRARGYMAINIKAAYLAIGAAWHSFIPLFAFARMRYTLPVSRIYDWETSLGRSTVAHRFSYRRSYSASPRERSNIPARALRRYKSLITGRKSAARMAYVYLRHGVAASSSSFRGCRSLWRTGAPRRHDNATWLLALCHRPPRVWLLHIWTGRYRFQIIVTLGAMQDPSLRERIMLIFQEFSPSLASLSLSSREITPRRYD